MAKLKIIGNALSSAVTDVYLNGVKVDGLQELRLIVRAGDVVQGSLMFNVDEIDADQEALISLIGLLDHREVCDHKNKMSFSTMGDTNVRWICRDCGFHFGFDEGERIM